MARRYTVTEENFTVAASMSFAQINGVANKIVLVRRWWWRPTDNTLATAQVCATRCRLLPATVTNGLGGNGTPSIMANDGGDAAASFTARTRDTTVATSSGTVRTYDEAGAHIYNGYDQQPEFGVTIAPSQAFTFDLLTAVVQGTVHVSIGVEVDEIG